MMRRKKESILDLLVEAPWWISLIVAGSAFFVLRYIFPAVSGQNFAVKALARTAPVVAPWVSLFLLIPAPISFYNSWRKRKLLDGQKDLDTIRSLSWKELEELVGEAYRRQGYTVKENAGVGPDGGIDLVLSKEGDTFLVQCKQWRSWKVGVKVVREMYGLMAAKHASGGIIIASGIFTQEAKSFAEGKPIDLVEGKQLADLVTGVQRSPAGDRRPNIVKASTAQRCPKCGAEMVLRTATKGKYAGKKFWGCSNFPSCKGLIPNKHGK
jgi:restriction system protein